MSSKRITRRRNRRLRDKFKYTIDNIMTKGTAAKVFLLMAFVTALILVFGIIIAWSSRSSYGHSLWQSFLHTLDPGTIAGSTGNLFTMTMLFIITIMGVIFTSLLIGIINNGMDGKMDDLSKGFTKVYERYSHTIILGFTSSSVSIIQELVKANENADHKCPVVIMDEHMSAGEMRDAVFSKGKIGRDSKTKLLFRNGCIFDIKSLDRVSIEDCDSIIINTGDDYKTMKTILACSAKIRQLQKEYPDSGVDSVIIAAVIQDRKYEREARAAGGDNLKLICYSRMMSKIIAGAGREYGLSSVYSDLFNYSGAELYVIDDKDIQKSLKRTGDKYSYSQHLKNAVVVGGIPAKDDCENKYEYILSSTDRKYNDYAKLIVLQNDDDKLDYARKTHKIKDKLITANTGHSKIESVNTVIIGYSALLEEILEEENDYFINEKGEFTLIGNDERILGFNLPENQDKYQNIKVKAIHANTMEYDDLDDIIDNKTESIIVLSDIDSDDSDTDEKTITQLLLLREIRREHQDYNFNITCEMKFENNKVLAEFTGANDYVIGNNLISTMAAQISQTPELYGVFTELLDSKGSEIYMRKASDYVQLDEKPTEIDYYTLSAAVARFEEVLIGIHLGISAQIDDGDEKICRKHEEPQLVPEYWDYKKNKTATVKLKLGDELIVMARD